MAERRMIAKSIIKSDQFLDMPATTQCLYFHLLLEADDDGFINAPKSIMRVIGAKDDDMRVLQAKGYIIPFESGVIVIKHWRLHNSLRKDRYNPNPQLENERKQLVVADNKEYQLATNWQPNGNQLATSGIPLVATGKDRLGKDRLGKDTYSPSLPSVAEDIVTFLNSVTGSSYRSTTDKTRKLIAARLTEGFTIDDFKAVITKKAKEWQGTDMAQYLRPETLFGTKFEGYLNQPEVRNNRRSPISRAEQERQEAINVVNELIAEYEEEERQNGQSKHDESNSTASIGF